MDTKELGFLAENIAARHLKERGFAVVAQNYRKPWGEIDIIAEKGGIYHFVEVKANRREFSGLNPEIRVNQTKLGKIVKTASLYIGYELKNAAVDWQVDIVAVTFDQTNQRAKLKYFKNVAKALW